MPFKGTCTYDGATAPHAARLLLLLLLGLAVPAVHQPATTSRRCHHRLLHARMFVYVSVAAYQSHPHHPVLVAFALQSWTMRLVVDGELVVDAAPCAVRFVRSGGGAGGSSKEVVSIAGLGVEELLVQGRPLAGSRVCLMAAAAHPACLPACLHNVVVQPWLGALTTGMLLQPYGLCGVQLPVRLLLVHHDHVSTWHVMSCTILSLPCLPYFPWLLFYTQITMTAACASYHQPVRCSSS
jgi:hypothetical protein